MQGRGGRTGIRAPAASPQPGSGPGRQHGLRKAGGWVPRSAAGGAGRSSKVSQSHRSLDRGNGSRSCAPDHPATLPYGHTSWTHMTRVITEPMTLQQEQSLCPRLSSASRTYSVWTPSQQTTAQRPQRDTEGQCQCGRTPFARPCMWDTERNGGGTAPRAQSGRCSRSSGFSLPGEVLMFLFLHCFSSLFLFGSFSRRSDGPQAVVE